MSNFDKLDDYKKEIRSVLIPYQKGCFLSEFNQTYREFIGRRLPTRELGFKTDTEFLYSIPDVVKITPRQGDYHLQAVADEKSKHIQKLVSKQKPAKLKAPSPRNRSYVLPPRFSDFKKVSEYKWPSKPLLKDPISSPPPVLQKSEIEFSAKLSPKEEVISLVQNYENMLPLDSLLIEYQRMYHKDLSLSKYGFGSVAECIEDIPELDLVQKDNVNFVVYHTESQGNSHNEIEKNRELPLCNQSLQNYGDYSAKTSPEVPSVFNSEGISNKNCDNVPSSLKEKLLKVAERFPDGIWASDFPSYFEEVSLYPLDLHDLGYRCLNDLIDDVPDIFIRKPVVGSRKDYIIYPADNFKSEVHDTCLNLNFSLPPTVSLLVDHVVLNLRKILEAYPEGVKIKEVLHVYSINCKDYLHIEDFGFDNVETFLLSIKNHVPLRFDFINGEKTIHLLKLSDSSTNLHDMIPEAYEKETIPFDAAFPEFIFKPLTFPVNFDFSKYFPVYASSVASPGHLYIQLQEGETTEAFIKLAKEIETFYNGSQSEYYMMKDIHIRQGASCVAKWPTDGHWYRAQIFSIPSMETVQVHYVDYGTRDVIPKFLLRYAKKDYINLPAQALRCRLAYLKPPKNAAKWDVQSRNRILSICEDVPLMARIEEKGSDGIYSIILCDTNGEKDVYINDVLCNEGLADCETADSNENNLVLPAPKVQSDYHHNLNPLQAMHAQYLLHTFAAVAPSFAQNENYLKLLKQVSACCQTTDPVRNQFTQFVGPPGFNPLFPNVNAFANSNLYNAAATAEAKVHPVTKLKPNVTSVPVNTTEFYIKVPTEQETLTIPRTAENLTVVNGEGDNEIFDDDDDEMFHQFCQKVSSTKIQYVKRVMLGDGYKIHVIVVESKPYASSGDISQLIWNNKEADYLLRRLQLKEADIPTISLSEDGNEELFQQLEKFNVKGVQKTTGFKSSILLYPLKNVIKILNLFGHPSVTLRTKLTEEIANFDPSGPDWPEFSPEAAELEDDDNFSGVTDDDKIERLCLFDLLAMKESILLKRKKIMNNSSDLDNNSHTDEIDKLEQLHKKVLQRIQEIKEICKYFT